MEKYSIVLFILTIMIGLSAVAEKIRLPYPVLLITAGIAIGFVPELPHIELDPEIIFLLFLPPLLYDAAFTISFKELKTHLHTVSTLAIGLVFLSAAGIAVLAHYLIPGMTWPLSFVLGAILSATDAVSAMSVTKGLGLSHKTSTILEGESLVNDASALVAYRFAVAAVTGSAFVWWEAGLSFVILLGGGFAVGLVMGKLLGFVLARVRKNNQVCISFMLLMPFVTYLLAEEIHVSGVIAVVVLGLSISRFSRKVFPEALKNQSRGLWDILIFLLNGLIFILIGLQLPYAMAEMEIADCIPLTFYAFLITVLALVLRAFRVFSQQRNLKQAFLQNKGRITEEALLDAKTSLIISWSGMRGIVSLATALALPATLQDGTPFPNRNVILFLSVAVVLFTIVGQGTTLPWLVRRLSDDKPVSAEGIAEKS
ncbi:MAG: Na+/H+ antiporter [Siphonobacter aquaeclarae]|jgi:Na+/H+ antiporter|nr:Na+/H+ antiporter [Siphonobacter aquaeclarae]